MVLRPFEMVELALSLNVSSGNLSELKIKQVLFWNCKKKRKWKRKNKEYSCKLLSSRLAQVASLTCENSSVCRLVRIKLLHVCSRNRTLFYH